MTDSKPQWRPQGDPRVYETPPPRWEWPAFIVLEIALMILIVWAVVSGIMSH